MVNSANIVAAVSATDLTSITIAVISAVVGIITLSLSIYRDRIKVRVLPKQYFLPEGGPTGLCVEVVNLGFHAVNIASVRLVRMDKLEAIPEQSHLKPVTFPCKLEPKTSFTVYYPFGLHQDSGLYKAKRAVAITQCGRHFYGESPAITSYFRDPQ